MKRRLGKSWSRREFLGSLAAGGTAALLGLEADSAEGFGDVECVKTPLNEGPSQALAAGKVDFVMNDPPGHLMSIDEGGPIALLAGSIPAAGNLFGNDSVHTLRDLKGKKVAAPQRSSRKEFVAAMVASVGLDPDKDIVWVDHEPGESMRRYAAGQIDTFMGFAPEPQELRARGIGHVILNTLTDRPWSQYFCCLAATNRTFMSRYPVATRRALRAFVKAAEICIGDPQRAARTMVARGVSDKYEYVLQAVREIGYRNWRLYDAEDTARFRSLRLREAGVIKISPKKVLAEATDWHFINELKREMKV